jgi:hypothetical protein
VVSGNPSILDPFVDIHFTLASPLASLASKVTIPPDIRTLVSEDKEDTSGGWAEVIGCEFLTARVATLT